MENTYSTFHNHTNIKQNVFSPSITYKGAVICTLLPLLISGTDLLIFNNFNPPNEKKGVV